MSAHASDQKNRFKKSIIGAVFGAVTGTRIAVRFKHQPVMFIGLIVSLTVVSFWSVWTFWPSENSGV